MQNISGNIANASTTGYKGIDTSFEDLIPQTSTPERQVAGGVTAFAQATITTQGTVSATTVAHQHGDQRRRASSRCRSRSASSTTFPVFDGITDYTRRGDFQLNANGNLVNGAGYYLMGVTVDPKTGNPTGNVPQVLQFQNNFIPAQTTTAISYAANLPTTPTTAVSSTAAPGTMAHWAASIRLTSAVNHDPVVLGTPPAPFMSMPRRPAPPRSTRQPSPAPITAATTCCRGRPTIRLTTNFAAGDTITVNGTTITFVNTGTVGNQIDVTDTVGTLLAKIDAITGTASRPSAPAAPSRCIPAPQRICRLPRSNTAAFARARSSAPTVTRRAAVAARTAPASLSATTSQTFTNESISGGAVTAYDSTGSRR